MKIDTVRFGLLSVVVACLVVIGAFACTKAKSAPTEAEQQDITFYLKSACEVASHPNKQVEFHNWPVKTIVDGAVVTGYIVTTDTAKCVTTVDSAGHVTNSTVEF